MLRLGMLSSTVMSARLAPSVPVPKFLVVDFDGTCTIKVETIALLPQLAAHLGPAESASTRAART
eukprot:5757460-Prymnesium_polylepis.1